MKESRPSELQRVVAGAIDAAVLVRTRGEEGTFSLREPEPEWWAEVFGTDREFRDRSPFLDDFLDHGAGEFWKTGRDQEGRTVRSLRSGIWEESVPGEDRRRFFEAVAGREEEGGDVDVLLVLPADERWREEQAFVQQAHDQSLARRRLLKELEKKQVLLECIMHDLGNPVATVLLNLQHLDRQVGEEWRESRPAIRRAIAQAERQRQLIRSIAEVFAADLAGSRETIGGHPPDLAAVAAETVAACAPAGAEAGVALCPFFGESLPVVAESLALSRVIENLLSNAIHHSPRGGRVTIAFEREGDFAVCRVEDEGPGIEADMGDRIFQPFVQGNITPGQSGLGLYFCRLTVEMWGGSIAAKNREKGGAAFVFRLPLAEAVRGKEGGAR